ncbi:amidohydrolase family protein [Rudaea cellulosilytica]|uniref:amidohydrolase family protein n=1 Tax=Rudaea cellulosilytica TaxID=540746 RepID=UPI0003816434|nr:amidohydrolase family protein [Rudaea cellulosilytica]
MKSIGVIVGSLLMLFLGASAEGQTLVIEVGKVYASPDAKPLSAATILIRDGKIAAIGRHIAVPTDVNILRCAQCAAFAGFWNTHVHFMEPKWGDAAKLPAGQLSNQLREMLTRSGFATVVDTGSDPHATTALRQRIESGEVTGPRIYTAGLPLFPPNALPYYVRDLPPELLSSLPQPKTPAEAAEAVQRNIAAGGDISKLFTGSIVAPNQIVPMPVDIAHAAVTTAHSHHQLVFSHATNLPGVQVALSAGVDVLAHAPEVTDGLSDDLLRQMTQHRMTVIPTLKLFSKDSNIGTIRERMKHFHDMGGALMFGTDTGFLIDYDVGEEYRQLELAGFSPKDVLAMLTTVPARRFGVDRQEGRVEVGMNGDLTVLGGDPIALGSRAMTDVRYTIRRGKVVYDASATP